MKQLQILSLPFVQDILNNNDFKSLRHFVHHGSTTCFEHTLDVAELAYKISSFLKLDYIAATRGALLHDFFMYNWRIDGPRLHGLRHPRIALHNASKHFDITDKEKDSILRHMWPLTPVPPRYPESWVVTIADKIISTKDYLYFIKKKSATPFAYVRLLAAKVASAIAPYGQSGQ